MTILQHLKENPYKKNSLTYTSQLLNIFQCIISNLLSISYTEYISKRATCKKKKDIKKKCLKALIHECACLTKWHQYIFSISLKFGACFITGQWGKFRVKNATICLHILFWYFFVVFHHKICVFIIFISFFDKVSNFRNRISTNQKRELVVSNCQQNCMCMMHVTC